MPNFPSWKNVYVRCPDGVVRSALFMGSVKNTSDAAVLWDHDQSFVDVVPFTSIADEDVTRFFVEAATSRLARCTAMLERLKNENADLRSKVAALALPIDLWTAQRCRGDCSYGGEGPACGLPGCKG